MSYINKDLVCSNCGKNFTYQIYKDESQMFSYESYDNYKRLKLTKCINCGFISDDISSPISLKVKSFINSDDYGNLLSNVEINNILNKLDESNYCFSNDYLVFSKCCELNKDYEKALNAVFYSVWQKETLKRALNKTKMEDFEDLTTGDKDLFDKIDNLLSSRITNELKLLSGIYENIQQPSLYSKLIYIEALIKLNDLRYMDLYKNLEPNLDDSLKIYFNKIV